MTPQTTSKGPPGQYAPGRPAFEPSVRHVPLSEGDYRWVYLWHWPIRAMHWLAALAIVTLVVTGFLIGKPYFMRGAGVEGSFYVGWVRLAHFVAAGILVATGLLRAYWLFAGNKFERLPALFPVRPRDWRNLWKQIKFYLLIHPERAPHYLGHNPLQQISYTVVYLVAALMVVTGFMLYGQSNPGGLIFQGFHWMVPWFGGIQAVRLIHHLATWYFVIFVPMHVYFVTRADLIEREGTASSIITGGKFVSAHHSYTDE